MMVNMIYPGHFIQANHAVNCFHSSIYLEPPEGRNTNDTGPSVGPSRWSQGGTRPSWPHRRSPFMDKTGCFTAEETQRSHPDCSLIHTAWNDRPVCVKQAGALATHQVQTEERSLRGPHELRVQSERLWGGLLIACSNTNWFSARSESEWQRVKGGISCFCIYNSVASCV